MTCFDERTGRWRLRGAFICDMIVVEWNAWFMDEILNKKVLLIHFAQNNFFISRFYFNKKFEIFATENLRNSFPKNLQIDPIKRPFELQSFQATQSPGKNQLRHSHFWGRFHDNSPRFNAHA